MGRIIDQDELKNILFGSISGKLVFYACWIVPCLPFLLKLTLRDQGSWGIILFEGVFNRYLWFCSGALILLGGILYCLYSSFPKRCQQLEIEYNASVKNNLLFALLAGYTFFLMSSSFTVIFLNDLQAVIHTYIAPKKMYTAKSMIIAKNDSYLYSMRTRNVYCTNGLSIQVKIDDRMYLDRICHVNNEEYGSAKIGDGIILHGKKSKYGFSIIDYGRQESGE